MKPARIFPGLLTALSVLLASCSTPTGGPAAIVTLADTPLEGKFVWHDLITDDADGAEAFYGELFGWAFERTQRPDVGDYTLIIANGRYIGGIVELEDPEDADYSRWLGYLSVDSVDRAADVARSAGGQVLVSPSDGEVARAAAIADPDGAVVGVARSHYGDPADTDNPGPGEVIWNELLAAEPEAMAEFYGKLAGLQTSTSPMENGVYRYLESQGRQRAGIMMRPNLNVRPVWLTHFSVEDANGAATTVARLGGTVLLDASPDLREGTLAVVTDPAGALFALHRQHERRAP